MIGKASPGRPNHSHESRRYGQSSASSALRGTRFASRHAVQPRSDRPRLRHDRGPVVGPRIGRTRGENILLLLSALCPEIPADPERYLGAGARPERMTPPPGRRDRVHLPDGPGNRPRSSGELPQMRHGPGAAHRRHRRGTEPRTRGHAAALLGRPGADRAPDRAAHGAFSAAFRMAGAGAGLAGRVLVRSAFLRACRPVRRAA